MIFTYICFILLTLYISAVGCHVAGQKFNLITNVIASILWPITIFVVVYEVVQETKDLK